MTNKNPRIIAIDFDGTIVMHEYPRIGAPVPGAIPVIKELLARGDKLILWTMRSGKELDEAVKYCEDNGINLYGVNINPEQHLWTKSPKAYAEIYIDDAAFNTALIHNPNGRPYLDWFVVRHYLIEPSL